MGELANILRAYFCYLSKYKCVSSLTGLGTRAALSRFAVCKTVVFFCFYGWWDCVEPLCQTADVEHDLWPALAWVCVCVWERATSDSWRSWCNLQQHYEAQL